MKHSAPDAETSRPIPQGYTHRPPPGAPGLPPPAPPLLTAEEEAAAAEAAKGVAAFERNRAEEELLELVEEFEASGSPAVAGRLRDEVVERAREGLVYHLSADDLHARFLFPNEETAREELGGRLVVITGAVAPHSMLDLADGFKVFDQAPYVHEPVLLATVHELSFVRCLLARSEAQELRDWEEVHLVGIVAGKERTDVIVRRCVVI